MQLIPVITDPCSEYSGTAYPSNNRSLLRGMQERRDAGKERLRIGGIQKRKDSEKEGHKTNKCTRLTRNVSNVETFTSLQMMV